MAKDKYMLGTLNSMGEYLPKSDLAEIISIGGLILYLSKDSRYAEIIDIQKMLRAEKNASEELLKVLKNIQKEIPYFKGVFDQMDVLNQLESTQITRLLYELSSINNSLEVSEWLDEALQFISSGSDKSGGESITPISINKLAISILNPIEGSFYDGVAGYGGGLMEAQQNSWKQNSSLKLYGQEINGKSWAISKIRLFISGDEENQILKGDVLNQPGFIEKNELRKFDFLHHRI